MKRTPLKRGTSELKRTTGFKPPTKPMQRTGSLRRKSPAAKERDKRYEPIRDAYMAAHPICEFEYEFDGEMIRCENPATEPHHKARKIGENRYRHLMACCHWCHAWIESHNAEARELGYLITDDPRRED